MTFEKPNYTETPNELFDDHMKHMGEAELRVVLAVVRKTLGYHKEKDELSLTQIQEMTGLSRQGAHDGVTLALEHQHIEECGTGKRGVKIYRLCVSDDQSARLTSQASRPVTSPLSRPELVKPVDTQKKSKEKGNKVEQIKESASEFSDAHTPSKPTEESSPSKAKTTDSESGTQQTDHVTSVPRGANGQQPKPKNGKAQRAALPKATQELIGKEVMGWETMTDYHWKLVNAETLAKHLLPFNVTEDELRNFKAWYNKRFPDAPYTSPGILLSKLDLLRADVKAGKFKLKLRQPVPDPSAPRQKKFNWNNIILYAEREGITTDEAIARLYPDR